MLRIGTVMIRDIKIVNEVPQTWVWSKYLRETEHKSISVDSNHGGKRHQRKRVFSSGKAQSDLQLKHIVKTMCFINIVGLGK